MAHFLFQWKYRDPAIKAIVDTPQDRPTELRKAVEGFGGKVHQFFYAFGEYDGIAIVEFPDNESCVASAVLIMGGTFRVRVCGGGLPTIDQGFFVGL